MTEDTGASFATSGAISAPTFVTFHMPDDPALVAGFGAVAIRHAQLDYELKLLIKTLSRLSVKETFLATARESSAELRRLARKLAQSALGDCPELLKIKALLKRCEQLTVRRNDLMHATCAEEVNVEALAYDERTPTKAFILDETLARRELPAAVDLQEVAAAMGRMVDEINNERLHGFIATALHARGKLLPTE